MRLASLRQQRLARGRERGRALRHPKAASRSRSPDSRPPCAEPRPAGLCARRAPSAPPSSRSLGPPFRLPRHLEGPGAAALEQPEQRLLQRGRLQPGPLGARLAPRLRRHLHASPRGGARPGPHAGAASRLAAHTAGQAKVCPRCVPCSGGPALEDLLWRTPTRPAPRHTLRAAPRSRARALSAAMARSSDSWLASCASPTCRDCGRQQVE